METLPAMDGITELLISRKTKAIEERKRKGKNWEDGGSDTTSSDSEESVKELICKKAKESKKRKQKLKELMQKKRLTKHRKTVKEPVGIGAELRKPAK